MSDEDLLVREAGGVRWITLHRPDAGNALTPTSAIGHRPAGRRPARAEVRAVVLTATGRHFCTGADLRAQRPGPERPPGRRRSSATWPACSTPARSAWCRPCSTAKPVLAAVNGTAAGIGAHLRWPATRHRRGRPLHRGLRPPGLVPDGGGAWLPRLVGLQRAKELVFRRR